jgi:hypothetical protein
MIDISNPYQQVLADEVLRLDAIACFKALTDISNPNLKSVMAPLVGVVTPEQFSGYCQGFVKGVEYVRDKFGIQPSLISITGEQGMISPYANYETSGIYIPIGFLRETLQHRWHDDNSKPFPFLLNTYDSGMMRGVEEALHICQLVKDPERTVRLIKQQSVPFNNGDYKGYDNQPVEHEALLVVRQAMKDLGVIERSPMLNTSFKPEDVAWIDKEYLLTRTVPTTQIDMAQLQQRINKVKEKETVSLVIR